MRGCLFNAHLRQSAPEITSCGAKRNRHVGERNRVERRDDDVVLPCENLPVSFLQFEVSLAQPWLIEDAALRLKRVYGTRAKEVKLDQRRRRPFARRRLGGFERESEDALSRGEDRVMECSGPLRRAVRERYWHGARQGPQRNVLANLS